MRRDRAASPAMRLPQRCERGWRVAGQTASTLDAVALAPADEDKESPDARPVNARAAGLERMPEPGDGFRSEPRRLHRHRIAQSPIHRLEEPLANPAIEGQDESCLGTFEQLRVQAAQGDTPEQ